MGGEGVTMPEVLKVKTTWSGFVGSPGYTNLFFSEFVGEGYTQDVADAAVAKTREFWNAIKSTLPTTVTLTVDTAVEIIQTDTGNLVGYFNAPAQSTVIGTAAGSYAAPAGACISWGTNGVRNGRRIRGRTFIVPLAGMAYEADGSIGSGYLSVIQGAANTLMDDTTTGDLAIWSRPSAPGATDGVSYVVETARIRDKVAYLSSRRD